MNHWTPTEITALVVAITGLVAAIFKGLADLRGIHRRLDAHEAASRLRSETVVQAIVEARPKGPERDTNSQFKRRGNP